MNKYVYLTILEYPDGVDFSAYSTEKKALKALSQTLEKIIQTEEIEDFILDTSSSQLYLLLQGEDIQVADFMIIRHALKELKKYDKEMISEIK